MLARSSKHSTTRWLLSSLLASAAWLGLADAAGAGGLVDSVRAALETNPEIGVVKHDRRAVDQELRQARARLLPSIDVRAAVGPEVSHNNNTRSQIDGDDRRTLLRSEAELSISQLLFDGFETQGEIERQRARVDSAARRVTETAEFVALSAIEAHLEVMRAQRIVELNEENVRQHENILTKVRRLEREGRGDIADVRQTEARLAEARNSLATAKGRLADAIATYVRVVGEQPSDLRAQGVAPTDLPSGAEEAARVASVRNPTVLIAAADVDVAAAELTKARAGFYPQVNVELGATTGTNIAGSTEESSSASALLVLRYNLFRGGADIAREREAFHRINEARASLAKARRQAEEEARVSWNARETAMARVEALRAKAEAQRRTRDAYAAQFDIGQRSLLDVLDAENELFLSRVALTTAEFTEMFAGYRLLAVTGELLDRLDLAPPREHIDIWRTPADEPTAERVEEKTQELVDPKMEPRPLRGKEAGEPPVDDYDSGPHVGARPAEPVGRIDVHAGETAASYASFAEFWQALTGGSKAVADAAPASGPQEVVPAAQQHPQPEQAPSSVSSGPARYDDFQSFWRAMFGGSSQ